VLFNLKAVTGASRSGWVAASSLAIHRGPSGDTAPRGTAGRSMAAMLRR
jgi:hypothetical protein